WILFLNALDQPLPEAKRLGVGVIDSEDANALVDPEQHDTFEFVPQRLPLFRLKVEGVDILILLRWVLSILNTPIRTAAKPLGMFLHVRVIRGALESEVESDLDPVFLGFCHQPLEVLQGTELGMDRLMPSLLCPNCPRAPRIISRYDGSVIFSLAVGAA